MSGLEIPLPTDSPTDNPGEYVPLLISAIEGFLLMPDVWLPGEYDEARGRMQELIEYVVELMESDPMPETPIGTIIMWPTDSPPENWYPCDGMELSRAEYPELFALVAPGWGQGNGTTTFNTPHFSGRSPMMQGTTAGQDFSIGTGGTFGEIVHTLTTAQLPAHNHPPLSPSTAFVTSRAAGGNGLTTTSTNRGIELTTGNRGGGEAHNNVHPVIGINFIIYAGLPA